MKTLTKIVTLSFLLLVFQVDAQNCSEPLKVDWIKKLISEKRPAGTEVEVWSGKLDDLDVIFFDECIDCTKGSWKILSCTNNLIRSIDKEDVDTAYLQRLTGMELLWTNACVSKRLTALKTPAACTKEFIPVCGCNNVTYPNACTARSSGVINYSKGNCNNDQLIDARKKATEHTEVTAELAPNPQLFGKEIFYMSIFHYGAFFGWKGEDQISFDRRSMPADANIIVGLQREGGPDYGITSVGDYASGARITNVELTENTVNVTVRWWYNPLLMCYFVVRIQLQSSISDLSNVTPFIISNYPSALAIQDPSNIQWVVPDGNSHRVLRYGESTFVALPHVLIGKQNK